MINPSVPLELETALRQLEEPDADASCFERVARWRRACGDAESAAQWQTWSLIPPETQDLRIALADCWRRLEQFEEAARLLGDQSSSWNQLLLHLQQGEVPAARRMQTNLLQAPPPLKVEVLLELVNLWRQLDQPEPALELLQQLAAHQGGGQSRFPKSLANACADLLERLERYDEAASWWQHSLRLDPWQNWPMMRLAHHSFRQRHPATCVHYCRTVLDRDPQHRWAPGLLRQSLKQLGAERSLQVLDQSTPQAELKPRSASPPPAEAHNANVVGLFAMDEPLGLDLVLEGWQQVDPSHPPLQLWLIASPDPLWCRHCVDHQLQAWSLETRIHLQEWPCWEPQRWPLLDLLLLPPACPKPPTDDRVLLWWPQQYATP
jgi:tetratricopeptide (TPR) repeat protein